MYVDLQISLQSDGCDWAVGSASATRFTDCSFVKLQPVDELLESCIIRPIMYVGFEISVDHLIFTGPA